jgi:DNA polymerase III delta prime subunit
MLDIFQYDPHSPKKVGDIVGNSEVWTTLSKQIRTNDCSHIVLCGPQGCGKSLFLRIVLEQDRESYHPLLQIDCTANAGLRDLRDSLRGFARGSRTNKGDYRWVVLEHADSLAADTQAFLRRMMETTSSTTRFLFECTDAGAISEPILSRSTMITVDAPIETDCVYELRRRTDYTVTSQTAAKLYAISAGNMRNALYYALSIRWNKEDKIVERFEEYQEILRHRPETKSSTEWIAWAIEAEKQCRLRGYDCRELMMLGWPGHPAISYMRSQWSRLGGISPRAVFYRAIHDIVSAE